MAWHARQARAGAAVGVDAVGAAVGVGAVGAAVGVGAVGAAVGGIAGGWKHCRQRSASKPRERLAVLPEWLAAESLLG